VLRNGLGAKASVWTLMFRVMPLALIYYRNSAAHGFNMSLALPPTTCSKDAGAVLDHVFRST